MTFLEKFHADVAALVSQGAGQRKGPVIRILEPRIAELQNLGFTVEKIAETMTAAGLVVTRSYLSTALHRGRKTRGTANGKTPLAAPKVPVPTPGIVEIAPAPGAITKDSLNTAEIKF